MLHLGDGRYALIECKLGSKEIEDGANHLVQLHKLIVEHNKTEEQMPIRESDLKIVLTGGQYGYTRNDGVHVIPLACLRDWIRLKALKNGSEIFPLRVADILFGRLVAKNNRSTRYLTRRGSE